MIGRAAKKGLLCLVVWACLILPCQAYWLGKDDWSLVYVSSENTVNYDERAIFAFDGESATHWFSKWTPSPADPLPHQIQIDLGQSYTLEGFSYLPRQSTTNANGRVGQYEFYVSDNPSVWGSAVASGFFENSTAEKFVYFTQPKSGRYIRFRAITEANGSLYYTACAEIGVKVSGTYTFTPRNLGITFTPSPDPRATGHKLYKQNMATSDETVIDLEDEIVHVYPEEDFEENVMFRFTATAYGEVEGTVLESVRSEPLYVMMVPEEDPPGVVTRIVSRGIKVKTKN